MFHISTNGIVTVNRGDTFDLPIILNIGTEVIPQRYMLSPTDILYIGIMEPNQPFENAIVRKKFTSADLDADGNIYVPFSSNDTICLLPGKYYYQVKLLTINPTTHAEEVETVVDKTLFYIEE